MNPNKWLILATLVAALTAFSVWSPAAYAEDCHLSAFNELYVTRGTVLDNCSLCHSVGFFPLTRFGEDFRSHGKSFPDIESLDSDDDGFTNIVEIAAFTLPQDAGSFPGPSDPAEGYEKHRLLEAAIRNLKEKLGEVEEKLKEAKNRLGEMVSKSDDVGALKERLAKLDSLMAEAPKEVEKFLDR